MITVCAFSDGHGYLPKLEKPADLVLLGGDNVPATFIQSDKESTMGWYMRDFCDWVNEIPFDCKVVFICGNHEVGFSHLSKSELDRLIFYIKQKTADRVIYLHNDSYRFWKGEESVLIFGSPNCKQFGYWAYMEDQETLRNIYSKIPENCDILLTHDAPYGCSDICYGWAEWNKTPEHIGNLALRDAILEKRPRYNIHGHLHTTNHDFEQLGDTQVVCVSLKDESYRVVYEPLYLEL